MIWTVRVGGAAVKRPTVNPHLRDDPQQDDADDA
jgi:hypothetical protein